MPEYITPDEVDALLKIRKGKAARLARRGLLPAIILPDKSIRFDRQVLLDFINKQSALPSKSESGGA